MEEVAARRIQRSAFDWTIASACINSFAPLDLAPCPLSHPKHLIYRDRLPSSVHSLSQSVHIATDLLGGNVRTLHAQVDDAWLQDLHLPALPQIFRLCTIVLL